MIYILITLSFLLESVVSNIVPINSFLTPLFVFTSLIILYPYFKNKRLNYIITFAICGLIYDVCFTDLIFINTICFSICGIISILCYNYFKYNIYSSNILNILNIIIYRIINYLILIIISYMSFNSFILLKGIYNSIIINIIYGVFIYLIANLISNIFNIKID